MVCSELFSALPIRDGFDGLTTQPPGMCPLLSKQHSSPEMWLYNPEVVVNNTPCHVYILLLYTRTLKTVSVHPLQAACPMRLNQAVCHVHLSLGGR